MKSNLNIFSRRQFMRQCVLGASLWQVNGLMAEALVKTPKSTEGPFYPDTLPLDTDNDLLIINDSINPGVGQVTWLSGRILDAHGQPVRNALVEIWQCDGKGVYYHSGSGDDLKRRDTHFQCFGRFLTGAKGEYVFRTIKPVPYPGRTPHIHFKVKRQGKDLLTTQCYIKGHPGNLNDGIWKRIRNKRQRDNVTVDFKPLAGSRMNELVATFDVVLGWTPEAI
ncbi:protocatechuate 3,4-dioxygenase [bacterium]|nr:protocatechuate 3,4-dioxygenase [Verrucomicrobiota bacterium]MDA7559903.1 protocatechuate 3,4-dioxygenase [bacterium]MDA7662279.1 protocatechuate 3,4-dioxygenase [Verrucomicrobiota bacterium]MDB4350587.1 protocatechuate 3,4-dioxygenase [Verrucomicrobiota bacterium]MDB4609575.1 protocatechuate 3,4-dioxygenase [Verrucomicrobiota bacterium]